ncbi:MAG: MFS transporter [Sphingomonadaceae bacterium]
MATAGIHPDIDGAYAWRRLAISLAFATLGGVGMWGIVVVLPEMQAEFGVARGDASLPYMMTMVGFGLGNAFIGRLVDRFGYMLPALFFAAMLGIGYILAGLAPSIWLLVAVQGLFIGLGSAVTFAPLIADISHWFVIRRGLAVSIAASGNYFAGAIWPLVTQHFIAGHGWREVYIGIGVALLAGMLPLALMLRRQRLEISVAPPQRGGVSLLPISLSPAALQALLMLAGFACCMAMAMPQVHIVAYCADLGYGVARGSEMLALMLGAGVVSRLGSGYLADRFGGIRTLLIGSVLQGLSLLFYIPFDGLTPLYLVSFMFGLSQGGIVPCYAVIVREYMPAAEAGRRVGVVIALTVAGMAVGGWMSGVIYDWTGSYAMAFLNGIAWNVVNVATMLLVLSRTLRRSPLLPA